MSENANAALQSPDLNESSPNVVRRPRTAGRTLAAQRRPEIFKLRVAGYTFREIAAQLDVDVHTAFDGYQAFLAENSPPPEAIAAQREIEDARIEDGIRRCNAALEDEKRPEQIARLLDVRLRYQKRRAELLGLDAPVQVHIEATVGIEVDGTMEITLEDLARTLRLADLEKEVRPLLPAALTDVIDVTAIAPSNGNGHSGA